MVRLRGRRLGQPPPTGKRLVSPGLFDVRSGEAALTPLGAAVAATASGVFVAADERGWWRQPDRVLNWPVPEIAA